MQSSQFQTNGSLVGQNITDNTLVNVTGMTLDLVAGITYRYRIHLQIAVVNVTSGYKAIPAFSGTATSHVWTTKVFDPVAGTLKQCVESLQVASTALAQNYHIEVEGIIRVTVAGTLSMQLAQNVTNASAVTPNPLRSIEAWPVSFA